MHDWTVRFKSGRWVGARSKGGGHKCDFDWKILLHSDLFNLGLRQKYDITKLFLDVIVFLDDNKLR